MTLFTITGSGLKPCDMGKLALTKNRIYYLGASSDPDRILVTDVDYANGWFEFYRTPIYSNTQPQRDQIKYMGDLIRQGCETRLKNLERYEAFYKDATPDWIYQQRAHLEAVLKGEAGRETHINDEKVFDVEVTVSNAVPDGWAYIDHLTGSCCNGLNTQTMVYTCTAHGESHLEELRNDPNLTVVKETWRRGSTS